MSRCLAAAKSRDFVSARQLKGETGNGCHERTTCQKATLQPATPDVRPYRDPERWRHERLCFRGWAGRSKTKGQIRRVRTHTHTHTHSLGILNSEFVMMIERVAREVNWNWRDEQKETYRQQHREISRSFDRREGFTSELRYCFIHRPGVHVDSSFPAAARMEQLNCHHAIPRSLPTASNQIRHQARTSAEQHHHL